MFTFLSGYAQESSTLEKINFDTLSSFQNLIDRAKNENKFIFIDVYANWCKPCKEMDKYVFTDSLIVSTYNNNFINIKINGENSIGKEFVEKYKITGYPSLLFFDNNVNLLYHSDEYMNVSLLYNIGMQILKKQNVNQTITQLKEETNRSIHKKYNDYPCEIGNIQSYINSISQEKLESEFSEITNNYTKCIEENSLYSKEYLMFLLENFISTKNDTGYTFYENHRNEFMKNYGDSLIALESNIYFYTFFENVDKLQQNINDKQNIELEDITTFEKEVKTILDYAEKLEKESKVKGFQATPTVRFYNVILNMAIRFYSQNKNKEMYYKYITDYYHPIYFQKYIDHKELFLNPVKLMQERTNYYLENFYSNQDSIEKLVTIWNYALENNHLTTSLDYLTATKIFYCNRNKQKAQKTLEKAFELKDESFNEEKYNELKTQINQL